MTDISETVFRNELNSFREIFINNSTSYEDKLQVFKRIRNIMANNFPDVIYFGASMCDTQTNLICFLMDLLEVRVTEDYMLILPMHNNGFCNIESYLYNYVNDNDHIRSNLIRKSLEQVDYFQNNLKLKIIDLRDRLQAETHDVKNIMKETMILLATFIVYVHRSWSFNTSMWSVNSCNTFDNDSQDNKLYSQKKLFLKNVNENFEKSKGYFSDSVLGILYSMYDNGDSKAPVAANFE